MSIINADADGLPRCCGNISALRDAVITLARDGGALNFLTRQRLLMTWGWCQNHDDEISKGPVAKLISQIKLTEEEKRTFEIHVPCDAPESITG